MTTKTISDYVKEQKKRSREREKEYLAQLREIIAGEECGKYWGFIATHPWQAIETLNWLIPKLPKREPVIYHLEGYEERCFSFCDVGCGTGNILLLFNAVIKTLRPHCGLQLYGVEHNKLLASLARKATGSTIYDKDAFDVDYSKFDIIYYYQPIHDKELMTKLERKIEKEAKVGCFIVAVLKTDEAIEKNKHFIRLDRNDIYGRVYKKVR